MILVIGGCGFLGSNFIRYWLANNDEKVVNIDPLFTGTAKTLIDLQAHKNYELIDVSIEDPDAIYLAMRLRPRAIINFASSEEFALPSNIISVYRLLAELKNQWSTMSDDEKTAFRFVQVSTSEVYGTTKPGDLPFNGQTSYAPETMFAASKASADLLVRSAAFEFGIKSMVVVAPRTGSIRASSDSKFHQRRDCGSSCGDRE